MFPSEISRTERFESELDALRSVEPRIDEIVAGVEWFLRRNPNFGSLVDGQRRIYKVAGADILQRAIACYYGFQIKHNFLRIVLLSIRIEEE